MSLSRCGCRCGYMCIPIGTVHRSHQWVVHTNSWGGFDYYTGRLYREFSLSLLKDILVLCCPAIHYCWQLSQGWAVKKHDEMQSRCRSYRIVSDCTVWLQPPSPTKSLLQERVVLVNRLKGTAEVRYQGAFLIVDHRHVAVRITERGRFSIW